MLLKPYIYSSAFLFIVGMANLSLGVLTLLKSSEKATSKIFGAICFCMFLWCVSIGTLSLGFYGPLSLRLAFFSCALIPLFGLFFSTTFPNDKLPYSLGQTLLIAVPSIILIAFIPGELILDPIIVGQGTLLRIGLLNQLYTLYMLAYFAWIGRNLFYKFRKASPVEKVRYGYFFTGLLFTSLLGLLFGPIMVLIGIGDLVYFGPLSTIFIVAFTAYAILKYQIMGIDIIIKKSMAYAIVTMVLISIYMVVALAAERIIRTHFHLTSFLADAVAATVIVVSFQLIYAGIHGITDRVFFRRSIEYQKVLEEVSGSIASVIEMDALLVFIKRTIMDTLNPSCFSAFIKGSGGYADPEDEKNKLSPEDHLIRQIDGSNKLLFIEELENGPDAADTGDAVREMKSRGFVLIVPALVKGRLVSVFCLGEKNSGELYKDEDIAFLSTLASETALAIDNSMMYDEQKRNIKKLQELDHMKSNFISNISHELRTPLSSIKGFVYMIRREKNMKEENREEFMRIIEEDTERLTKLINRLLNLSRFEPGNIKLNKMEFDLIAAVREVMDGHRTQAEMKKIIVENDMSLNLMIHADPQNVKEALSQFLENAIEYTYDGGRIKVSVRDMGDEVSVSVADTGCGIPETELPHIFDRFYKVEKPIEQVGGIGLGLALVKNIVDAHGGKVCVESHPGRGSRFAFTMPTGRQVLPAVAQLSILSPEKGSQRG